MDALFVPLAEATGASLDQIKLISCLLVSYPLGSIFIRIPSTRQDVKHIFNLLIAVFYFIPVLHLWNGFAQLMFDVLGTYYIAKTVKSAHMPWIVFWFVMGHLTVNHIIRAMFNLSYETVEVTGPQMVLTMKLTTFAWNVWDGRRQVEELDKWQKEKRVDEYPSLLAFLGYAFYFPGVLVGPYLEYADYMSLIDGSLFKTTDKVDAQVKSIFSGRRIVPRGRKRVAYKKMVFGLVYLGTYVVFGGSYNYGVAVQDWFAKRSIFYRIALYQFVGVIERTKYYAIWTLTEGAAILTGLGFTGYGSAGETTWEGAANVDIFNIEFAPNIKVLLDSWNMKTNVWLRECIYKRVTPKGKKPGFRSTMITFATSAFWHGIAGGYYLTFLFGGFAQTVGRMCRTYIRPLVLPANYVSTRGAPPPPQTTIKKLYDVTGTFFMIIILNYMASPFMLSTIEASLLAWGRLWWYGHFIIVGALVFFYSGGSKFLKGIQTKRAKAAGVVKDQKAESSGYNTPLINQSAPPLDDVARAIEKADFLGNMKSKEN
ncbi:MBOAT, membrane-bound O-acyltransferase family-domain-containing protein [Abortiporus biennis]|nr:MBOAT, membrane-bound O-acyltransferase family-domain-containing protein [Abortiporus biennis]